MRIIHLTEERQRSIATKAVIRAALTVGLTICISLVASSARAQSITACVNNKSGAVSIISKGSCPRNTHAVVLNPGSSPTLAVQTLNIVDASNKVLASVSAAPKGGASMNFLDSNGKRLAQVGMDDAGKAAGILAFDGNALVSGSGATRAFFGVQTDPQKFPGFGLGVRAPDGTPRMIGGEGLDGSTIPSSLTLYDGNGAARTGLVVNPSTNFNGFFDINSSGVNRVTIGSGLDDSFADALIWDSDGNIRNGLLLFPDTNFNGFFSRDSGGTDRALVASGLDDSYSDALLLDENGAVRNGLIINPDTNFSGFFDQSAAGKNRATIGHALDDSNGGSVQTFGTNNAETGHLP